MKESHEKKMTGILRLTSTQRYTQRKENQCPLIDFSSIGKKRKREREVITLLMVINDSVK